MPVIQNLVNAMVSLLGTQSSTTTLPSQLAANARAENPIALYGFLRLMASNASVYSEVSRQAYDLGEGMAAAQGLRNPTAAVIAFYRSVLMPGTLPECLPIETPERVTARKQRNGTQSIAGQPVAASKSDNLEAAIQTGWLWSNLGAAKQIIAGGLPMLGDQFLKIVANEAKTRVYMQRIEPEYMTLIECDDRGYLELARIDVPRVRRDAAGRQETYIASEVWSRDEMRFRYWEHRSFSSDPADFDALGTPKRDEDLRALGVDYVPIVQMKFRDDGLPRGVAAILPALDKVVYGDLLTTALHQRLTNHNRPDRMLVGVGVDTDGLPIPAPSIDSNPAGVIEINGEKLWALPSGWRFEDVVASLDYTAHLAVCEAHYKALQRTDLPELAYFQVAEASDLSGKALHYMLLAARSKAEEVRGNMEAGIIRADSMLLSVAQSLGLPGFRESEIGRYEDGSFTHWFAERDIWPAALSEEQEISASRALTVKAYTDSGATISAAARAAGLDDDTADDLESVGEFLEDEAVA